MVRRENPRRRCREYEREWRGRCVDVGLADTWLERLNQLEAFRLISVCEGHVSGYSDPHGSVSHVKLRLKEGYLPEVASRWDEHKLALLELVARLFQTGDTYVNLELKLRLRVATGRLGYEEALIARVHRRGRRVSDKVDADTRVWFEKNIPLIEELDAAVVGMWYNGDRPDGPMEGTPG
jgi:hypothetical protein